MEHGLEPHGAAAPLAASEITIEITPPSENSPTTTAQVRAVDGELKANPDAQPPPGEAEGVLV